MNVSNLNLQDCQAGRFMLVGGQRVMIYQSESMVSGALVIHYVSQTGVTGCVYTDGDTPFRLLPKWCSSWDWRLPEWSEPVSPELAASFLSEQTPISIDHKFNVDQFVWSMEKFLLNKESPDASKPLGAKSRLNDDDYDDDDDDDPWDDSAKSKQLLWNLNNPADPWTNHIFDVYQPQYNMFVQGTITNLCIGNISYGRGPLVTVSGRIPPKEPTPGKIFKKKAPTRKGISDWSIKIPISLLHVIATTVDGKPLTKSLPLP